MIEKLLIQRILAGVDVTTPTQEEGTIVVDEVEGEKVISLEKGKFGGARMVIQRNGEELGKIY